jgi:hypothetical protein
MSSASRYAISVWNMVLLGRMSNPVIGFGGRSAQQLTVARVMESQSRSGSPSPGSSLVAATAGVLGTDVCFRQRTCENSIRTRSEEEATSQIDLGAPIAR